MTTAPAKPWWPLALVALSGIAFDAACYYPGAMSLDSAVIWSQARGAPSTNVYGAGLRWLWWLVDKFWSGPEPLFLIQLLLFWSGLVLIARSLECGLAGRFTFLLTAAFAPAVFVLIAHVWTDVMLLATLAFAVGALLRWRDTRGAGWFAVFWFALVYAVTLRHNGLPALLPLAAYAIWLDLPPQALSPTRKRVTMIVAVTVLALGLQSVSELSAWSAQRYFTLWSNPAMWDLAAISLDTNQVLLPAETRKPELALDDLRAAYVPYASVPIYTTTHGRVIGPYFLHHDPAVATLRKAWLAAIVAHPVAYAAHRWRATRALFGNKPREWPHELTYVDEELQFANNPAVTPNRSALHGASIRYAEALRDTALLAPWPYLALGVAALALAGRRRARANAQAALAVLASGLAYAAPLPLITPGADLRYLGWTCLAAVIGAALALPVPRRSEDAQTN